MLIAQLVK